MSFRVRFLQSYGGVIFLAWAAILVAPVPLLAAVAEQPAAPRMGPALSFATTPDEDEESAEDWLSDEPSADDTLAVDGAPAADEQQPANDATKKEKTPAAEPAAHAAPLPPLTDDLIALRNRLRKVLAQNFPRHLNAREHSCWEVMHGIIAYGVDAKVYRNGRQGPEANAIGWMCFNQPCHGEQLFYLDRGKLVPRRGPGLQGHAGQFLALLAQSHVPADFPMKVGGKDFTLVDLIEHEKSDCRVGEELTFKLISLAHYLDDTDTQWTSRDGQTWNIERLIKEELKQPILRVAACGGTHRLMGHSYALYKRRKQGKPIDGQFARAEKFIKDYHRYTYSLQNPDGSFSTRWFEGREARPDIDRRLKTTGHILEWMAFSVPDEQLRDPRMVKAVNYLVDLMARNDGRNWEVGPRGHALHALRIYDRRLFKPYDQTVTPTSEAPVVEEVLPTAASELPTRAFIQTARKNTATSPAARNHVPLVPPIEWETE